jgi:catechol 2,3-dioxygenase-like lactoylglutathione lyase family enzyme
LRFSTCETGDAGAFAAYLTAVERAFRRSVHAAHGGIHARGPAAGSKHRKTVQFLITDQPDLPAEILGLDILWEYEDKAIGFDLGPVLIVEDVSSEEDRNERDLAGRYVGCSIEVEDIQATYSELVAKGVHFTAPPEKQEWGGTLAHFEDPAGNVLTLVG